MPHNVRRAGAGIVPPNAPPIARNRFSPFPSSHPALFSHSTFTFIASWQGQLLVCTVVLFLGAIYFFVRGPIDEWRRRRREVLARERERELMEMERQRGEREGDGEKDGSGVGGGKDEARDGENDGRDGDKSRMSAKERGREKRKKRKGSLLRAAGAGGTSSAVDSPSSLESSPAPGKATPLPLPASPSPLGAQRKRLGSVGAASPSPIAIHVRKPSAEPQPASTAPSTGRQPPPPPLVLLPQTTSSAASAPAWETLPETPASGPSRVLPLPAHAEITDDEASVSESQSYAGEEDASGDNDADGDGEGEVSGSNEEAIHPNVARAAGGVGPSGTVRGRVKSEGFSIIPEDGYLPAGLGLSALKKKKKKSKSQGKVPGQGAGGNESASGSVSGNAAEQGERWTAMESSRSASHDGRSSVDEREEVMETPTKAGRAASAAAAAASAVASLPQELARAVDPKSSAPESSSAAAPQTPEKAPGSKASGETPRPSFPSHSRISSISKRPSLTVDQLREIVEQRDDTIEGLRMEIGVAKAEEAKAHDELVRARGNEERLKGDLERVRRGGVKTESEARRREQDLQGKLRDLTKLYNSAVQRLASFESLLREAGTNPPPASPLPIMHPQNSPIPVMPSSPYAPSPGRPGSMYMGFPSPGMYPSPMLHPFHGHQHPQHPHQMQMQMGAHPHQHGYANANGHNSPVPFRRASSGMMGNGLSGLAALGLGGSGSGSGPGGEGEVSSLAGPLTPGLGGAFDMESGIMPLGQPHANGHANGSANGHANGTAANGVAMPTPSPGHLSLEEGGSLAERRRMSVESTVLKRKKTADKEGEKEVIEEEAVGSSEGDGEGSVGASASASGSSSPAPGQVQGEAAPGVTGVKVRNDGEGNVYYAEPEQAPEVAAPVAGKAGTDEEVSSDPTPTALLPVQPTDADPEPEQDTRSTSDLSSSLSGGGASAPLSLPASIAPSASSDSERRSSSMMEPIFASLAHTPEQLEEMRQMREDALRERERTGGEREREREREREGRGRGGSVGLMAGCGVAAGAGVQQGVGGLLTPSPSKSPVPL
ncbi:hypothetical protein IAT38_004955 [Cryptococcus sp. DSM 104549]